MLKIIIDFQKKKFDFYVLLLLAHKNFNLKYKQNFIKKKIDNVEFND